MPGVEFDPETRTYIIYYPWKESGCDTETWTVKEGKVVVRTCIDGRPTEMTYSIEDALEDIVRLAKECDDLDAKLLAIILGAPLSEFFLDARFVFGMCDHGKLCLQAVELLPCMGDRHCEWIRVDGDTEIEKEFLDHMEELLRTSL